MRMKRKSEWNLNLLKIKLLSIQFRILFCKFGLKTFFKKKWFRFFIATAPEIRKLSFLSIFFTENNWGCSFMQNETCFVSFLKLCRRTDAGGNFFLKHIFFYISTQHTNHPQTKLLYKAGNFLWNQDSHPVLVAHLISQIDQSSETHNIKDGANQLRYFGSKTDHV